MGTYSFDIIGSRPAQISGIEKSQVLLTATKMNFVLIVLNWLRVFENRLLRRIFGPKRDEVTGGWRKLHNEELRSLYSSPSIITMIKSRRMRWAGHVARMGEKRNAYRILVEKPEGKRPLGRPRRKWVNNIKIDLTEMGWCGLD
jgi:hypothetical protein